MSPLSVLREVRIEEVEEKPIAKVFRWKIGVSIGSLLLGLFEKS
jgi:hypothetical protein